MLDVVLLAKAVLVGALIAAAVMRLAACADRRARGDATRAGAGPSARECLPPAALPISGRIGRRSKTARGF